MKANNVIDLTIYTDPVCVWCWQSEPIVRKLEYLYDSQINFSFIMSGLVKDLHTFLEVNDNEEIDIEQFNSNLMHHWKEASAKHNMPVSTESYKLFNKEYQSTYPLNIMAKAVQMIDNSKLVIFLRKLREEIMVNKLDLSSKKAIYRILEEIGINIEQFNELINNNKCIELFYNDLNECKKINLYYVPTYIIKYFDKEIKLEGYVDFDTFYNNISKLTNDQILPKNIDINESTILDIINKFSRLYLAELLYILNVPVNDTSNAAYKILYKLADKNIIKISNVNDTQLIESTVN